MLLRKSAIQQLARKLLRLLDGASETVTYAYKATQDATATNYTPPALFLHFREEEVDMDQILRTDLRCIIAVKDLPVTPTRWDQITRPDGTKWQVMHIRGGTWQPVWELQVRQVG